VIGERSGGVPIVGVDVPPRPALGEPGQPAGAFVTWDRQFPGGNAKILSNSATSYKIPDQQPKENHQKSCKIVDPSIN